MRVGSGVGWLFADSSKANATTPNPQIADIITANGENSRVRRRSKPPSTTYISSLVYAELFDARRAPKGPLWAVRNSYIVIVFILVLAQDLPNQLLISIIGTVEVHMAAGIFDSKQTSPV